ncbi:hypothetical protein KAJ87_00765 [Candidatus Pacearchaeota archaeon]|nr:hypothetical protein [Candidatus Pacearchaeota archaeon]
MKDLVNKIKSGGKKLLFAGAFVLGISGCMKEDNVSKSFYGFDDFNGVIGEEYLRCYNDGLRSYDEIHLKIFEAKKLSDSCVSGWKIDYVDERGDKKLDYVLVNGFGMDLERYTPKDLGKEAWAKVQKKYKNYLDKIQKEKIKRVFEKF